MNQLPFSERPGARERQLMRRYANPLFDKELQLISLQALEQAQQQDKDEEQSFAKALHDLLNRVAAYQGKEETEVILAAKKDADLLYEQCAGLAGDHQREREGLLKLNDAFMKAIRSAAGQDPLALSELDNEQQAREIHLALLDDQLVTDILRRDGVIHEDQLLPTILSAEPASIDLAMNLFNNEQRQVLIAQAQALTQRLQQEGKLSEEIQVKVAIIHGET